MECLLSACVVMLQWLRHCASPFDTDATVPVLNAINNGLFSSFARHVGAVYRALVYFLISKGQKGRKGNKLYIFVCCIGIKALPKTFFCMPQPHFAKFLLCEHGSVHYVGSHPSLPHHSEDHARAFRRTGAASTASLTSMSHLCARVCKPSKRRVCPPRPVGVVYRAVFYF